MSINIDYDSCQISPTEWKCPIDGCGNILSRKQTLKNHLRNIHESASKYTNWACCPYYWNLFKDFFLHTTSLNQSFKFHEILISNFSKVNVIKLKLFKIKIKTLRDTCISHVYKPSFSNIDILLCYHLEIIRGVGGLWTARCTPNIFC